MVSNREPPIEFELLYRDGAVCPRCELEPSVCRHFKGTRDNPDGTVSLIFHDYLMDIHKEPQQMTVDNPLRGVKTSQILTALVSALLALLVFIGNGALNKIEKLGDRVGQLEMTNSTMRDRSEGYGYRLERIENKVDKLLERNLNKGGDGR